jgi:hypothetical protein
LQKKVQEREDAKKEHNTDYIYWLLLHCLNANKCAKQVTNVLVMPLSLLQSTEQQKLS